ncbi:MAG TPA: aldo/keto reductase [Anaerolineales bacterium]|nr:aldo/keto reductase [Anaerolineales bacterium]HLO33563.1 aldo/keto reductase [Anaerolineales bacterium]
MAELSSETRFLHAIEMGLGAWQWGDRVVWQYGHGYGDAEVRQAFQTSLEEGIRFVDTAEIYGNGRSERLLGQFLKETDQPVLIATKFLPFPWRFGKGSLTRALKGSLARLGVESVDLYQIHWPTPIMSIDAMMGGLAECAKSGMTRTVGVSNFGQSRMLAAYSALARHNIPLASNQVHYSLLNRTVERNGTLARCKELGIRLIAYSPIEKGLLSGKYNVESPPPGARARNYAGLLPKIGPLLKIMTEIGQDHGGKSNPQVALNWLICKGALPIPGAKNAQQAQENAGGLGWRLKEDEVVRLDEASDAIGE